MKLSPAEREALDHVFSARPRPSRLAVFSAFALGVLITTLIATVIFIEARP